MICNCDSSNIKLPTPEKSTKKFPPITICINSLIKIIKNNNSFFYNTLLNLLFTTFSSLIKYLSNNNKFPLITEKEVLGNIQRNICKFFDYCSTLDIKKNYEIYNCLSSIYGAFLGDAMGAFCEFNKSSKKNFEYIFKGLPRHGIGPGQVTDDSEMAMSLAYAIFDCENDLNSDFLYYFYGFWNLSKPKDIGINTKIALKNFNYSLFDFNKKNIYDENFKNIKENNYKSLANGFLMRKSTFIVWLYLKFFNEIKIIINETHISKKKKLLFELYKKLKIESEKDNICTHPNPELSSVSASFSFLTICAIYGLKPEKIISNAKILFSIEFNNNDDKIVQKYFWEEINYYDKFNKISQINYYDYFTQGEKNVYEKKGYYLHAFRLTLFYLYYFNKIEVENNYNKFQTIMNQINNLGGDTDTNCAIVGTVIGPLIGYKNFGEKFKKMFELIPKGRPFYSPGFMVVFVLHLFKKFKGDGVNIINKNFEGNFLKYILKMMYKDFNLEEDIIEDSEF